MGKYYTAFIENAKKSETLKNPTDKTDRRGDLGQKGASVSFVSEQIGQIRKNEKGSNRVKSGSASKVFEYIRNKIKQTPEFAWNLGTSEAMRSAEDVCAAIYDYRRELIDDNEMQRICDEFINSHIRFDGMKFDQDADLFTVNMEVSGKKIESKFNGSSMSKFQGTIAAGVVSLKRPGVIANLKPLN